MTDVEAMAVVDSGDADDIAQVSLTAAICVGLFSSLHLLEVVKSLICSKPTFADKVVKQFASLDIFENKVAVTCGVGSQLIAQTLSAKQAKQPTDPTQSPKHRTDA